MISLRTRFDKKFISFLTIVGLCIPTLLSVYPSHAYADEQHKTERQLLEERYEREQKAREAAQIAKHKGEFIGALCRVRPNQLKLPTILSPVEQAELDIGNLIGSSALPMTEFGYVGLVWLSTPIANHAEIYRRQGIVRSLVEHESSFNQLRTALQTVKKGEDALIMYWNKESKLHSFIKRQF